MRLEGPGNQTTHALRLSPVYMRIPQQVHAFAFEVTHIYIQVETLDRKSGALNLKTRLECFD
jgi:hypothetical protein